MTVEVPGKLRSECGIRRTKHGQQWWYLAIFPTNALVRRLHQWGKVNFLPKIWTHVPYERKWGIWNVQFDLWVVIPV